MPFYNSEPRKTNTAVDKLQQLAGAARQVGNVEAANALDFAAELVTKRLANCAAEKTLRDEMAMTALGGLLATCEREPGGATSSLIAAALASASYELADAMLEAREV